jgi:hypothetical protein
VAEGARLESVFAGNRNAGSNPAPSANPLFANSHKHPTNPINTSHISQFCLDTFVNIHYNPHYNCGLYCG